MGCDIVVPGSAAFSSSFLLELLSEGYAIAYHSVIEVCCFQQPDYLKLDMECIVIASNNSCFFRKLNNTLAA